MDMQEYLRNRQKFSYEELEKYAGKYIAWSSDGTQIIASDQDLVMLAAAVTALGYESKEIVLSFVPLPDEVILGGATLGGGIDE